MLSTEALHLAYLWATRPHILSCWSHYSLALHYRNDWSRVPVSWETPSYEDSPPLPPALQLQETHKRKANCWAWMRGAILASLLVLFSLLLFLLLPSFLSQLLLVLPPPLSPLQQYLSLTTSYSHLAFLSQQKRKEKKDNPVVAAAAGANNKTDDSPTKPKSASWKQMITSSKPKTKWALGILDIKIATFHGSSSSSSSHPLSKVETSSGAITPPTNPILSLLIRNCCSGQEARDRKPKAPSLIAREKWHK